MALNITQAAAVNTVVDALAGGHRGGNPIRTEEDLRDALVTLAAGANKALMAGVSPDEIPAMKFPHYVATPEVDTELAVAWGTLQNYIDGQDDLTDEETAAVDVVAAAVGSDDPKVRLEFLRQVLRAERISWGELHELQGLAEHIDPGDVELLEAAGVPEFPEES